MFRITWQPVYTNYLLVGLLTDIDTFSSRNSENITVLCTYGCVHHYTGRFAWSFKCDLPLVTNHARTAMSDLCSCAQLG